MGRNQISMSPHAADAVVLFGAQIHTARVGKRWSVAELAARSGVSTYVVKALERGTPSVSVGNAFNVAAAVGMVLFGADSSAGLRALRRSEQEKVALLPARVRSTGGDRGIDLDF